MKVKCCKDVFIISGPPCLFVADTAPVRPEAKQVEEVQLNLFT
jgi:hypothetical protein